MDKKDLQKILESEKHETDYWDFKETWQSRNGELLKDILGFANTAHHKDCYLIYGVNDNKEVVGVENDPNRKDQQKVDDFLVKIHFANKSKPIVEVEQINYENKIVDVLTIKDSDDVPYYLKNDYHKDVRHGEIIYRHHDSTFGKDVAPDYEKIEGLWKKHFHLDLLPEDRFSFYLNEIENWDWQDGEIERFFYKPDQDFLIEVTENTDPDLKTRAKVTSFSYNMSVPKVNWCCVTLKYKDRSIENLNGLYLDDNKEFVIYPDKQQIGDICYYYFCADSFKAKVSKLINHIRHNKLNYPIFNSDSVVVYEDKDHKKDIEKKVGKSSISVTDAEIDYVKKELADLNIKDYKIKALIESEKLAKYINTLFL